MVGQPRTARCGLLLVGSSHVPKPRNYRGFNFLPRAILLGKNPKGYIYPKHTIYIQIYDS